LQHFNVRTPRWLGFIIQTPEKDARHPARGLHIGNSLFDLLGGSGNLDFSQTL
jgi:hypothetical protein